MLCSKCSAPVRPVVAVDIDGTMARWHEHFFDFAEHFFGLPYRIRNDAYPYDGSVPIAAWLGVTQEQYRQAKLAFRSSGLKRSMPPYGEPSRLSSIVRGVIGAEFWVTTTRPYLRMDNIDEDTRIWLRRHGVHYDGLLYDEDKYSKLMDIVGRERIVAIVDDEVENYDRAAELGLYPVLMQRQHNATLNRKVMANNEEDLLGILQRQADAWKLDNR